jgi:hypothetical protein
MTLMLRRTAKKDFNESSEKPAILSYIKINKRVTEYSSRDDRRTGGDTGFQTDPGYTLGFEGDVMNARTTSFPSTKVFMTPI